MELSGGGELSQLKGVALCAEWSLCPVSRAVRREPNFGAAVGGTLAMGGCSGRRLVSCGVVDDDDEASEVDDPLEMEMTSAVVAGGLSRWRSCDADAG